MRVLHILEYNARIKLVGNKTVCGQFVRLADIAEHDDNATCPACRQWVAAYNAQEVS